MSSKSKFGRHKYGHDLDYYGWKKEPFTKTEANDFHKKRRLDKLAKIARKRNRRK